MMKPRDLVLLVPAVGIVAVIVQSLAELLVPGADRILTPYGVAILALTAIRPSHRVYRIGSLGLATALGVVLIVAVSLHAGTNASVVDGPFAQSHPETLLAIVALAGSGLVAGLFGWLLFHRQEVWLALTLAGVVLLLRADVSLTYTQLYPLMLMLGVALVLVAYLPGGIGVRSTVAALVPGCVLIVAGWQLPTIASPWSRSLIDPLASLQRTSGAFDPSRTLSLSGPFHPSDQPVMSIRLDQPLPHPYWRIVAFDHYDGHSWTVSTAARRVAAPEQPLSPAVQARNQLEAHVTLYQSMQDLTFPGTPLRTNLASEVITGPGMSGAVQVQVARPLAVGDKYVVMASPPSSSTPITAAASAAYHQLPSLPARVRALAQRVVHGSRDPLSKAQRMVAFLHSPAFRYDASAGSPPRGDAVDHFLFGTRHGYCNQFATAMAVMIREIGLMSRVVTGYAGGTSTHGAFLVRERDAHTWVEVYIPNRGWVSFDPTPGFATGAATPQSLARVPALSLVRGSTNPVAPKRHPGTRAARHVRSLETTTRPAKPSSTGLGKKAAVGLILLLAAALIGALSYVRLRTTQSLDALYSSLTRGLGDVGRIRPDETPLEFAARFQGSQHYADVALIVDLYTRERYAGATISPAELTLARRARRRLQRHAHSWLHHLRLPVGGQGEDSNATWYSERV